MLRASRSRQTGQRFLRLESLETRTLLTVDILLHPFTVPETVNVGEIFMVDITEENIGTTDLAAGPPGYETHFYLSEDEVFDEEADTFIRGVSSVDGLTIGLPNQRSIDVAILPEVEGDFFLIARSDATDSVAESDETNNEVVVPIHVEIGARADLVVTDFDMPSTIVPEELVTARWIVLNQGEGNAASLAPLETGLYLSSDQVLDDLVDIRLGTDQISISTPIEGGGGTRLTSQGFVVPDVAPGSYYLLLDLDDSTVVPETDEANNLVAVPVNVAQLTSFAIGDAAGVKKLTFPGEDGKNVTISLKKGDGEVAFTGDNIVDVGKKSSAPVLTGDNLQLYGIDITGSNDRTNLSIKGSTTVQVIQTVDPATGLNAISAKGVTVEQRVDVNGALSKLDLGALALGADVETGSAAGTVSLKIGSIEGSVSDPAELNIAAAIKSLQIAGDASFLRLFSSADLPNIKINGNLTDSQIGTGYTRGLDGLIRTADDAFMNPRLLKGLAVKGDFARTDVAATTINSIKVTGLLTDNGGDPFGLILPANTGFVKKMTSKDPKQTWINKNEYSPPGDPGDFELKFLP